MSTNPMAWDGGVNPKIADNQEAQDCLLPMGALPGWHAAGVFSILLVLGLSAQLVVLSTVKSLSIAFLCNWCASLCVSVKQFVKRIALSQVTDHDWLWLRKCLLRKMC